MDAMIALSRCMIDAQARASALPHGDDVATRFVLALTQHMEVLAELHPGNECPNK